ncbi:MAG: PEP-CTERM sorting domain-containing protein [Burkholderiales bacterium]
MHAQCRTSVTALAREPHRGTYAMMLAGFGLLGIIAARRRRRRASAG